MCVFVLCICLWVCAHECGTHRGQSGDWQSNSDPWGELNYSLLPSHGSSPEHAPRLRESQPDYYKRKRIYLRSGSPCNFWYSVFERKNGLGKTWLLKQKAALFPPPWCKHLACLLLEPLAPKAEEGFCVWSWV